MSASKKFEDGLTRCSWLNGDALYRDYHDTEWGVPVTGDQQIFERIALEGFQAGLSWITILKRREGFRKAFKNFDLQKVSRLTESDIERLMLDEGIIRNRAKIESTIRNANLILELQKSGQSIAEQTKETRDKFRVAGNDRRISSAQQTPAQTRLRVRRPHNHVCADAGSRFGKRSRTRLL
jgi:DNA-3-methyladenine glycosylase I